MKLIVVFDKVFIDLGSGYLLFLCSYKEYKDLSIFQLKELVDKRIREKKNE